MSYTVFIPAAGMGTRLGTLTNGLGKPLINIANKPAISRVFEQFPHASKFVIALGHRGELLREYVCLAHGDRNIVFVEVDKFEGPGSGLGYTMLSSKHELQEPFIFCSCDTLTTGEIPPPNCNWMAMAEVESTSPYRSLLVEGGGVRAIVEKGASEGIGLHPYIGLAGIHDWSVFWLAMESEPSAIEQGESVGMRALLPLGVAAATMPWFDTGNPVSLEATRAAFALPNSPHILEKPNEAIWFVGARVIKYCANADFIANRVRRARELAGYVPEIRGYTEHFYSYDRVEGDVLSDIVTERGFDDLLIVCKEFWQPASLSNEALANFEASCMSFYRKKTIERVGLFYENFGKSDREERINGVQMPSLSQLLDEVPWKKLSRGVPGRYHGDFHFENIIIDRSNGNYVFIDWRQDFLGSLSVGDIYYDLAKLKHGLIVSHGVVLDNKFSVKWEDGSIEFSIERRGVLIECERILDIWLESNGYSSRRVDLICALVYLNIAALHHFPYSLFLYVLGKSMLFSNLRERFDAY